MGGDCGVSQVYAYVKIDGEIIDTAEMSITSYNVWDTGIIPEFLYDGKAELVVGIYVRCEGEGNGAWGKIDEALLNSIGE